MIHQYKLNGYNIVLDVYSGAVHVMDDVAYDIIPLFCEEIDKHEPVIDAEGISAEALNSIKERAKAMFPRADDTDECVDDIKELMEEGLLFSKDVFRVNADSIKERHTDIKALCLHVSHACDLTCSYCFAGQGKFNGPSALMSLEVGKRAIDFLVEHSGSRRNLEVDFFGGEPLLNFAVVKDIVKYARSIEESKGKNFRFTLTTNGMGINDEVIEFANEECHNVVLSLDGRREIHDRERKTAGSLVDGVPVKRGTGSYDIILPKFKRMVEERKKNPKGFYSYYMRGTYTHFNTDFTEDIFHMTEQGFDELSMEPVVADPDSPFALQEEDMPVLMEQYEILAKEMLKREKEAGLQKKENPEYIPPDGKQPFNFYHYNLDLSGGPCIYKRIAGCGSGTEYFAVTPKGELYPCHQFVGDENYLMGDIWQGVTNSEKSREFKSCNVYAREECDSCWAKLYCSGGCAANAYHASGDILGVYEYGCRLFKKRMECAIMMEVSRRDEN